MLEQIDLLWIYKIVLVYAVHVHLDFWTKDWVSRKEVRLYCNILGSFVATLVRHINLHVFDEYEAQFQDVMLIHHKALYSFSIPLEDALL